MSVDIRLPNINADTPEGQIAQMRSYLYQFSEQLNWALNHIESGAALQNAILPQNKQNQVQSQQKEDALTRFNELKSLIIKSADIVNAYYDKITQKLSGVYVAQSDFGDYVEETANTINLTSDRIETAFKNIETIYDNISLGENTVVIGRIENEAIIKTGLLDRNSDNVSVYGVEVGQITKVDGVEIFNKYARFTPGELSFYNNNDVKVAYISDYKMYITEAEIKYRLKIGNYMITEQNGGLTFIWQ